MRKQADGKVRRSRAEWERIFDRFHSGTMTGAAFCQREKIAKSSFEKWRKKIGRRPKAAVPSFVGWPTPTDSTVESTAAPPALSSGELELSLPGGVVIRWKA
jgi:hypothetical protein